MGREVSGARLLGASLEAYERSEDPLFALEPLGQMMQSLLKSTAVIFLIGIAFQFGVKPVQKFHVFEDMNCSGTTSPLMLSITLIISFNYRFFESLVLSWVPQLQSDRSYGFVPMAKSPGDDKKAQSLLFCGQHTRKLHTPTPQGPFWATGTDHKPALQAVQVCQVQHLQSS